MASVLGRRLPHFLDLGHPELTGSYKTGGFLALALAGEFARLSEPLEPPRGMSGYNASKRRGPGG